MRRASQLCTDKGREWDLVGFALRLLGHRCAARRQRDAAAAAQGRHPRKPHRYVFSKRNVRANASRHAPPQSPCRPPYPPPAPSTAPQTRVERFNREINNKALKPVKAVAKELERQGLLDKEDDVHTAAFAAVVSPLLQYGLELLRVAHNHHPTPRVRCVPGTGGVPLDRAAGHPHPGPASHMPIHFDPRAEYESHTNRAMRDQGAAALSDPLAARPLAQQRRAALVQQQLGGSVRVAWEKLHANDLGDVCAAFVVYLACV